MSSRKPSANAKRLGAFRASLGDMGDLFEREQARRDELAAEREEALYDKACASKNRYATRADALDAATRERLQAMIVACRGLCEQVLSTLGATCESVSSELKRADAAVAQLPEAFTTLEGQLDELKKFEQ